MIALVKLAGVFAGIVVLLMRKWNLGLVLLLASIAVGLLFSYPIPEIGLDVWGATVDVLTLRLAMAVVLIMLLGELLRETESMHGMVESLQALIPSGRIVIAALPALIGLLPMVGGAMFSAPLVDEVGNRLEATGSRKTFVNYWFRHVWEPIFPLYPSMLLAAELMGLSPIQLAERTWPLILAILGGGILFGLVGLPRRSRAASAPTLASQVASLQQLAKSIWPIALVILLSLGAPKLFGVPDKLSDFVLLFSLVLTIVLLMAVERVPLHDLGTILRDRIPWRSVVVIFGALIFRRILENTGAVFAVSEGLTALNVPLEVIGFGAPFIAGLLTGLMSAAFSIGFPVTLPLITTAGGGLANPAWVPWLLAGGFLGTMCSPMHLCLALTRVYYEAEWGAVFRRLAPAVILVGGTAGLLLVLA